MKPMNSSVLNNILDKLADIGKKHVAKSNTMLKSMNIKDDMIRIASKEVIRDTIERKLRTGYVPTIAKQGMPFTALPSQEKDDKKKPKMPGSAMAKYPSGSESNTPYNPHGGDQSPAASTLAGRQEKMTRNAGSGDEIVRQFDEWAEGKGYGDGRAPMSSMVDEFVSERKGFLPEEISELKNKKLNKTTSASKLSGDAQDFISNKIKILRDEGKDEAQASAIAYSMARKEGYDVPEKKASVVTASSKISEVIQDLKQEDLIFVDVRDVTMRLVQKGENGSFDISKVCQTLADEGITLIKTAMNDWYANGGKAKDMGRGRGGPGRGGKPKTDKERAETHGVDIEDLPPRGTGRGRPFDGIGRGQGGPGRGMGRNRMAGEQLMETEAPVPAQPEEYGERLDIGKMIEMEHKDTIEAFRNQMEQGNDLPDEKVAEMIATDHLKENPAYYDPMMEEAMAGAGHVIEAASIESIKDDLNHAREQLKHYQGRLGEKGLEDGEKERYQKSVTKWNKTIDRLDRELSRAMKSERKKEREEAKAEKAQEQAQEPAVATASIDGQHIVIAQEPLSEPTFELEKFLSPAEYQEVQRLLDLRGKTWETIAQREERNIEEGLPNHANIDYSEVEVLNSQITQYQELAKSRKTGETLPNADKPEAPVPPEMPGAGAEMPGMPPAGGAEEGILTKKPEALPEFASQRNELVKKAMPIKVLNQDFEAMPVWNMDAGGNKIAGYKVEGEQGQSFNIPTEKQLTRYQLEDEIAKKIQGARSPSMQRKAVTSQDFPEVCKNCKSLCVPAGYKELSFLDHRDKPVCTVTNPVQKIGFRYAYMRECRGYDPIIAEITQQVKTPGESIFKKLEDRGEKPILKKSAGYEKTPKNEAPVSADDKKEAMERGKKICPKCVSMGYFVPRGEHNPVHDWHSLWNCDFNSVAHNPKGVCLPRSLAGQSQPEGGPNQFDSAGNRVVNVNK